MTGDTLSTIMVAFFAAVPPTLVAWRGLRQGKKNGEKADQAVTSAKAAAVKADEVHTTAKDIVAQAVEIKEQTDGQLSSLREQIKTQHDENQRLYEMLQNVLSIMSAREGGAVHVRKTDDAPAVLKAPTTGNGDLERERRGQAERRKSDGTQDDGS